MDCAEGINHCMNRMRMLRAVFCLAALLATGCTSRWVMDVQSSSTQLLWPQLPEKPKVRHLMTIRGFKEEGASVSTLIFGKSEDRLIMPVSVATGVDGRIAVADTGAKRVHLYIPKEGKYIGIFRENLSGTFSPVGVAFDDELRLYVSDSLGAKISVFDREGKYVYSIDRTPEGPLKRPTGLAYDRGKKTLYAVDTVSHKVFAFPAKGESFTSFGVRGNGDGQFNFPTHIFRASAGRLFVTDAMNFRIQIFDASGRFLASFGRQGDGSGDFSMPKGIASDSEGVIYVVDTLFDNVQLFDEKGEFLMTIGSRGVGQGEFWLPSGIYIDEGDKLYVCDTYNQRIQVFEIVKGDR